MIEFIFALVCAGLALMSLALFKAYEGVPAKELKRLARSGDAVAGLLYKPVAYGSSLQALLWLVAGIAAAVSAILFANILPGWLAVLLVAFIIWVGFAWLPRSEMTHSSVWLARQLSPGIAWILEWLHPAFSHVIRFVRRHRPVTIHTGLYEKEDILELLERQKAQPDSRISATEVELLTHTLSFGDKRVSDVLVPKRVVTFVNAADHIGPVLTDELHKSGHSRFPVFEGKHDNVVGILYLRDLVMNHHTGSVASVMKRQLTYVHEDFTLLQTLQAFLKTKQQLFLVVNSFEELVGIITIEDLLEQVLGQPIIDEFDSYEDMRAVAQAAAQKEHEAHEKAETEPPATPDTEEVVE